MGFWDRFVRYLKDCWTTTAEAPAGADTEFTCEVVRITRIVPHPNADRLEIARFELSLAGETTYEVIVQKGEYKAGDLAVYFSVDCLLPLSHPDFAFLKQRPDGQNKEIFRLRAARLRGVFSQGLLTPAPAGANLGDPMAQQYGVDYYRYPELEELLPTQASKKPRPQAMQVYGVDSLKKNPRVFEDGELVEVTEKIHGCNFRFGWVRRKVLGIPWGHRFVVGSHRAMKGDQSRGPGFYKEDVWLEAAEKMGLKGLTRAYPGYHFYGELYGYTYGGKALQDLTYGRKPEDGPGLAVFDIKSPQGWLTPTERRTILIDELQLPMVPVLWSGTWGPYADKVLRDLCSDTSSVAKGHIREGVVVETQLLPRKKAKYVGEAYLMRKEKVAA